MEREVLKRSGGYWHVNRDVHSKAFEALTCYLKDTVANDKEVLLLADFNRYYTHLLHEFDGENFIDASSSSQKLEEKIKNQIGDEKSIMNGNALKGNIVFSSSMKLQEAITKLDTKGLM